MTTTYHLFLDRRFGGTGQGGAKLFLFFYHLRAAARAGRTWGLDKTTTTITWELYRRRREISWAEGWAGGDGAV